MTVFGVEDLCRSYAGVPVVDHLSVTVSTGELVAITGPNGSGKSTILRCLAGAEAPDAGMLTLDAERLEPSSAGHWRAVHALLGDSAWLPELTVADHLQLSGVDRTAVVDALETVGAQGLEDRIPTSLSAGQRQRVLLADAALRPWRVLLLDEPERHLDADGLQTLLEWLTGMRDRGPVLVATHEPRIAALSRVLELV